MPKISEFGKVIAIGLLVRFLLAPFFAHPYDVYVWYVSAEDVLTGTLPVSRLLEPYYYSLFLFAIPGGIAFNLLSPLLGSFSIPMISLNPVLNPGPEWNITVVPGILFDFLVKMPLIASDTLLALLLYRMSRREWGNEKLAVSVTSLWFLNPLVIWVSSGWGMFDTLPALFTVLTLYFVLKDRFAYSGVSLAVAVAMKDYAVVLIVPFLLTSLRRGGRKGLLGSSVGLFGSGTLLFAPLFKETAVGIVGLVTGTSASGLHYSGLSFWTAITIFNSSFDQTPVSLALIIALLAISYILAMNSEPSSLESCAVSFALPLLALLLFFRFVGENYFIWLLPFAALLAVRGSRSLYLYWGVSLVALFSSVVDSLLPYYMLPLAPWIGGYLVTALSFVAGYRVAPGGSVVQGVTVGKVVLSAFGIVAAGLLVGIALEWFVGRRGPARPPSEIRGQPRRNMES